MSAGSLSDLIDAYDGQAAILAASYDDPSLVAAYAPMEALVRDPKLDALALDVGAGSGRDAGWLRSLGYEVVAAEPARAMREEGERRHGQAGIRWFDDRLPGLERIHALSLSFDVILLSGVWQHVIPGDRARAFRKLATLLKPGGTLILSLRRGPSPADRTMHEVSAGEVETLARINGLDVARVHEAADQMGRTDVRWTLMALRLPDDGAGALPLIRGIILADEKSSTYKLALLRAVARIAEHAPATAEPVRTVHAGAAPDRSDGASLADEGSNHDVVAVPLGLVALFWVRQYLPLVRLGLPQMPKNLGADGLGFAKAGFRALLDQVATAQELRVGAGFASPRAETVHAALGEAASTIATMPANFTRFPNSDRRVFGATRTRSVRHREGERLDVTLEYLRSFGTLTVPGNLWRAMCRLGAWIEPMLTGEWSRMMATYAERMGRTLPPGQTEAALVWEEPIRDTVMGRLAADRILVAGQPVTCVWSGTTLTRPRLDIDHCLPWSAWPCGDLWNLMPSDRRVNQHEKRDKLPSRERLADARPRILEWWQAAWQDTPALRERFGAEVRAALPVADPTDLNDVYTALEWRRLRLRQDQQLPEWKRGQT